MKVLTIQQPWASAIVAGIKLIENRSWPTHHTGGLVIHAARTTWPHSITQSLMNGQLSGLMPFENLPRGAIIGIVDMVDCQEYSYRLSGNIFASGPWCWIFRNPKQFVKPFHVRGAQGLWTLPEGILSQMEYER